MYKVNKKTKIGRKIDSIISNNIELKSIFEKLDFSIGFLTGEYEEKQDKNIQIFNKNRINILNNPTDSYIAIPGCIVCAFLQNSNIFSGVIGIETINIEVVFGSLAASSRQEKNKITTYKKNSHRQLKELELLTEKKVNFTHSLDTNKELTTIKISNKFIEVDTVNTSASFAINMALIKFIQK